MISKTQFLILLLVVSVSICSIPIIVSALTVTTITTTTDNADRRSYTWCPLNQTNLASFGGEIEGCPMARVYVNNWHNLTVIQQTTIDTMLRSKGFIDSGEDTLIK